MDRNTIFRRTAAGQDEIKTRQRGIGHNHRFVLIMVDGRSNVEELEAKSASRWSTVDLLQDLLAQGLIEPVGSVGVDKLESAPAGIDSRSVQSSELKTEMVAAIKDIMGDKGGEKLIASILSCQEDLAALADAVDSGCALIKLMISEEKANMLKVRLHEILAQKFKG